MNNYMIVAALLIAAGVLGLVYDRFTYTTDKQAAKLGPIELTVTEKETVNIPVWAGAGSIAVGVALMAYGGIRK